MCGLMVIRVKMVALVLEGLVVWRSVHINEDARLSDQRNEVGARLFIDYEYSILSGVSCRLGSVGWMLSPL